MWVWIASTLIVLVLLMVLYHNQLDVITNSNYSLTQLNLPSISSYSCSNCSCNHGSNNSCDSNFTTTTRIQNQSRFQLRWPFTSEHSTGRAPENNRSSGQRPCKRNDTYCGNWKSRKWIPNGLLYRDISSAEARECLGNRTLAFIGDSMIRDIGIGVGLFLQGENVWTVKNSKLDKVKDINSLGTIIDSFPHWKSNAPGMHKNGRVMPTPDLKRRTKFEWQIQIWTLYRNWFHNFGQSNDILSNRMPTYDPQLRKIDFAFWNHGLHDYGWWSSPPYYNMFYQKVLSPFWLRLRQSVSVPVVWVSMNSQCKIKLPKDLIWNQYEGVEEVNWYLNRELKERQLPYWDAAEVLRTPTRCSISADGVHVKMWVDIVRAKILFNKLCDDSNKWIGSIEAFL